MRMIDVMSPAAGMPSSLPTGEFDSSRGSGARDIGRQHSTA